MMIEQTIANTGRLMKKLEMEEFIGSLLLFVSGRWYVLGGNS